MLDSFKASARCTIEVSLRSSSTFKDFGSSVCGSHVRGAAAGVSWVDVDGHLSCASRRSQDWCSGEDLRERTACAIDLLNGKLQDVDVVSHRHGFVTGVASFLVTGGSGCWAPRSNSSLFLHPFWRPGLEKCANSDVLPDCPKCCSSCVWSITTSAVSESHRHPWKHDLVPCVHSGSKMRHRCRRSSGSPSTATSDRQSLRCPGAQSGTKT